MPKQNNAPNVGAKSEPANIHELAADQLRADYDVAAHVADAFALAMAVAEMNAADVAQCVGLLGQLVEKSRPDNPNETGEIYQLLTDLGDLGLPVRRLAADATGRKTFGWAVTEYTGAQLMDYAAQQLTVLLAGKPLEVGEPVLVVGGFQEAGATGRIRKATPTANGYVYRVHIDATSATRTVELPAAALLSLQAPATNAAGNYYTPVYKLGGSGNTVLLSYPDLCAPDKAGAIAAGARFANSLKGVFAAFNGLAPTGGVQMVAAKEKYLTAQVKVGADNYNVVVVGGPAYESWLKNEIAGVSPKGI